MPKLLSFVMLIGLSPAVVGISQVRAQSSDRVIPMSYGVTSIQLTPDLRGTVVLAWRENYNVHSSDVLSVYAQGMKDQLVQDARLQIVPIFTKANEQLFLTAGGGADCRLTDFRLTRTSSGNVALIIAERAFGDNYGDTQEVTFSYFYLAHNTLQDAGLPRYYFEFQGTQKSKKRYCDVNEAFKAELGLGGDGRWGNSYPLNN